MSKISLSRTILQVQGDLPLCVCVCVPGCVRERGEGCSIGYFTNYTSYLIRQMSNIILKGSIDSMERGTVEWNNGMVEYWNGGTSN